MTLRNFLLSLALLAAAGCAGYGANLKPGQSVLNDVQREMGKPTLVQESPSGERVLWYSKLPYGRENYAVRVGPDGRVISVEQRLSHEFIRKIVPKQTRSEEVLELLGPPYQRSDNPRKQREVWDYPLLTSPERQTLFVEFGRDGVVQELYQLHDRDRGGLFVGSGVFLGFGF